MWAGAPENGGVTNGMFCDGAHWKGVVNFKSSGNVGIGTATPAGILDVEGGTATTTNAAGTNINIVAQNGNGAGFGGNIILTTGTIGDGSLIMGGVGINTTTTPDYGKLEIYGNSTNVGRAGRHCS